MTTVVFSAGVFNQKIKTEAKLKILENNARLKKSFGVLGPLSAIYQLYHCDHCCGRVTAENHRPWESNWKYYG
jgi:hypothetical protein